MFPLMKTEENLKKAFAGESEARNRYHMFAAKARKEGWLELAEYFDETAANEHEHARVIMDLLHAIGDSGENLKTCIHNENYEWQEMYPGFEKEALEEGQLDAAEYFKRVTTVEKMHAARFKHLLSMLEKDELLTRTSSIRWQCRECGYIYEGVEPPEICPLCGHPHEKFKPYHEIY